MRQAGKVCFWGSVVLMLSVFINHFSNLSLDEQLKVSALNVLLSVIVMAIMFAAFLKKLQLSFAWLAIWLLSLLVAVPLQAKLVGLW